VTVISTLHQEDGVRYRVLGRPASTKRPTPAEPGLEVGYMWLTRGHQPARGIA
jgi:hypothetical protein